LHRMGKLIGVGMQIGFQSWSDRARHEKQLLRR
jgi:hypothetical protein